LREDAKERSAKYSATTEEALKHLRRKKSPATVEKEQVDKVLELVTGYVNDARHYRENKPITSLACIAYAEGLLDALKFLGIVDV
jgi:FAD synthetase